MDVDKLNSSDSDSMDNEEREPFNYEEYKMQLEPPMFRSLTLNEVQDEYRNMVKDVQQLTQLSAPIVRRLLQHYKCSPDDMAESYYENPDALLAKVGIEQQGNIQVCEATKTDTMCGVCWSEFAPDELASTAQCGHGFCNECWTSYLTCGILDMGYTLAIRCPASDCNCYVDDDFVRKTLQTSGPRALEVFERSLTHSYIESSVLLQFCKRPTCDLIVVARKRYMLHAECTCGQQFCFNCGEESHAPLDCQLLARWNSHEKAKHFDDNTKPCPKCATIIEKNGGCNHMICVKCHTQFCWRCGQPFVKVYDHIDCEMQEPDKLDSDKKVQVSEDLKRYMNYYSHYINHSRALKFAENLRNLINSNIEQYAKETRTDPYRATMCLRRAADIYFSSRRTLMLTYPFAFFVEPHVQVEIFEQFQQDLEKAIDVLHRHLTAEICTTNLKDFLATVVKSTTACKTFTDLLANCIDEGNTAGWWKYRNI